MADAAAQTYGSGPGVRRPQFFTYGSDPGEGLWPEGRPSRITVSTAGAAILPLGGRTGPAAASALRAPGSEPKKAAAIDAYDSQSRLLGGELSYVWGTAVELYWPMDRRAPITEVHHHPRSPTIWRPGPLEDLSSSCGVLEDRGTSGDDPDGQQHRPQIIERGVPERADNGQSHQQVQAMPITNTMMRARLPSSG